ncbi:F0-ATPase subunit E [Schizosaccharomyces cryophilus OY26]|uniref:ATP synthase F(0) complex subunit e, mitochondrial n=1 Tax=Schizosaccharomyces cryophilus (strain OY26 / ATCC MYA-4695 / CBS 11777 / NBRC 106824 / NRRL Y48691) TaxID=653667 RepID=S9X1T2_SCHCR|nr:F0-ATPase subunit E [Schizosaccharomyces cryophilus OY26]EPY51067.1 F0-ATPase subunit E [Schizosaccharomyces cryophilus OY26]
MIGSLNLKTLRWSALAAGLGIGWFEYRSHVKNEKQHAIEHKYHQQQVLIEDAKAAYARSKEPLQPPTESPSLTLDADNLEAYLARLEKGA